MWNQRVLSVQLISTIVMRITCSIGEVHTTHAQFHYFSNSPPIYMVLLSQTISLQSFQCSCFSKSCLQVCKADAAQSLESPQCETMNIDNVPARRPLQA